MDIVIVLLRAAHIVAGVFWAGTMIFAATLLGPAIGDAGPDGGKVMAALLKRGMLSRIPEAAAVTLLSGLWLYWRLSNHLDATYLRSHLGMALGTGGLLALVAFAIGMGVVRPSQLKAMAIMGSLGGMADGPEKQARQAEAMALRARAMGAGRVVAVLLALTVLAMAVARYV